MTPSLPADVHFARLIAMYAAAPTNEYHQPRLSVAEGEARIEIDIHPDMFHSAGATHGNVYFKALDDSCFFAANSLEPDVFVLTTSFTTYITRPISAGTMTAVGRVVNANRSQWIVESVATDTDGREVARGNGIMVRSKVLLADVESYTFG